MAKEEQKESKTIISIVKGESIRFKFDLLKRDQIRRCATNLNNQAVKHRKVTVGQSMYSVLTSRENNYIEVIRNY